MKAGVFSICLLIAGTAAGQVVFDPPLLMIDSRAETSFVNITRDGSPVSANSIGGTRFLVGDSDYGHMIRIDRGAGGVSITPTNSIEIGTYDLEIEVSGVPTRLPVRVTLSEDPESLANRAKAQGLTELDIQHQLGLYTEGRQSVRIDLPEWYYLGKIVSLNMPTPAGVAYEWHVNGELESSGLGPHTFTYPLTNPGPHEFRYVEKHPGGGMLETMAHTEAREEAPVATSVAAGREIQLVGPPGYTSYTWLVDDVLISEASTLRHRFREPGEYVAACIASGNPGVADEAFRKVTFLVRVD